MNQPLGVILAGGLARRMGGGDKGLLTLGGQTILARVIDRLEPQVAGLALNANGDAARFAEFGLPVLSDSIDGFVGPLAGVLAGLDWAAKRGAPRGGDRRAPPRSAPPNCTRFALCWHAEPRRCSWIVGRPEEPGGVTSWASGSTA